MIGNLCIDLCFGLIFLKPAKAAPELSHFHLSPAGAALAGFKKIKPKQRSINRLPIMYMVSVFYCFFILSLLNYPR